MASIQIPGYKIVKTLGVGGQATVYLAIQEGFEREVALKIMSPALAADPSFGERFVREARIVAKLTHPNIVTVYDVGEYDGFYYLAMEYLPGVDLRHQIPKGVKTRRALEIVKQVAMALDYAHGKGYIHRDVKSENILFRDDDVAVLTDFGIAKASNSSTQMTQDGKLIGTPQYMSPEQCRGKKVDSRSDIYSLGIIFYEMVTQKVPFDGEDSVAVCLQHVTKAIPQFSARHRHYQWLLSKMLAKKPEDRFQKADELIYEIDSYLSGDMSKPQWIKPDLSQIQDAPESLLFDDDDEVLQEEFSVNEQDTYSGFSNASMSMDALDDKKARWWPYLMLVVFLGIGGVGYYKQADWLPHLQAWYQNLNTHDTQPAVKEKSVAKAEQKSEPKEKPEQKVQTNQETVSEHKKVEQNKVETLAVQEQVKKTKEEAQKEAIEEARRNELARLQVQIETRRALPSFEPKELKELASWYIQIEQLDPASELVTEGRTFVLKEAQKLAQTSLLEDNDEKRFTEYRDIIQYLDATHVSLAKLSRDLLEYQAQTVERKEQQDIQEKIKISLMKAKKAFEEGRMTSPREDNAHHYFNEVLINDIKNEQAKQGLQQISDFYVERVENLINEKQVSNAKQSFREFFKFFPKDTRLVDLRKRLEKVERFLEEEKEIQAQEQLVEQQVIKEKTLDPLAQLKIESSLSAARLAINDNRFVLPIGDNALEKYQAVLAIDANHKGAREGIVFVKETLVSLIEDHIKQQELETANQWLGQLRHGFPKDTKTLQMEKMLQDATNDSKTSDIQIEDKEIHHKESSSEEILSQTIDANKKLDEK